MVAGRPLAKSTWRGAVQRADTDVNTRDDRSFAPRDRVPNHARTPANVISDASAPRRVRKLNGIRCESRFPSVIADFRGKIGIARGTRCNAAISKADRNVK